MMADEKENKETEENQEEKSEKGGSKILLIVIVILLLLLLIIGGAVAYFLLSNNDSQDNPDQAKQEKVEKKKTSDLTQMGPIYPLDQFIVNLLSNNSERYLKCKISLELDAPDLQQELDKKLPAVRDMIIQILSSKTVEEIQTARGKEKLKEEIKRKLNAMLTTGEIKNVYFTEFVIQ